MDDLRHLVGNQFRLLAFRNVRFELPERRIAYWLYVLLITALVGAGRYWDHPSAYSWQYLGLGSLFYIFLLSAFLYMVILPLRPQRWSYEMVFLFVGFTSLPAILYATPVERFMPLEQAQAANAIFLAVVAIWRVALYVTFLIRAAGLSKFSTLIATLLPLSVIVFALTLLNLEHVVFNIMAGIKEDDRSANDLAYTVVFVLSVFAYFALPITGICYVVAIYRQWWGSAART